MKIKKMNDVFRVVRGYLGGFRWNEEIATRWAFPIAFSLMIASFGIMKHIPSRIESGEWVYVIMAMIAVTMIWVNAVQFIMMHFKLRADARANRKREEEENALNDL